MPFIIDTCLQIDEQSILILNLYMQTVYLFIYKQLDKSLQSDTIVLYQ